MKRPKSITQLNVKEFSFFLSMPFLYSFSCPAVDFRFRWKLFYCNFFHKMPVNKSLCESFVCVCVRKKRKMCKFSRAPERNTLFILSCSVNSEVVTQGNSAHRDFI